ncbi:hypothetical protein BGZ98_003227, partial [Dissophora globulifera]
PKVLDNASRARQLRHHLESLERDNFVALNEFEAIIATAAAAASAPGPATLHKKPLLHDLEAVGSIVGDVVGTIGGNGPVGGSGSGLSSSSSSPLLLSLPSFTGGRAKHKKGSAGSGLGSATSSSPSAGAGAATTAFAATSKPLLPKKPLTVLLDESGISDYGPDVPTFLSVSMGPSRYPGRHFCSVCGWKGIYQCNKCGMRYCDPKCQKAHEETRQVCMKFTI